MPDIGQGLYEAPANADSCDTAMLWVGVGMRRLFAFAAVCALAGCNTAPDTVNNTATNIVAENASGDAENAVAVNAASAMPGNEAAPATAETVSGLPLKRGFYVASDTPCGGASNATLLLFDGEGFNGSRDSCQISKIEKRDVTHYRVTETCSSGGEAWGTEEETHTSVSTYEITSPTSYKAKSEGGWESAARYCAQASLPEPWRDNDISDIIK